MRDCLLLRLRVRKPTNAAPSRLQDLAARLHFFWSPPSIPFRSEFVILARVPPVFFGEGELKEWMKLSAFFSERVAW